MANGIVRFDPFEDLNALQRDMNRLFDESYGTKSRGTRREGIVSGAWSPVVDIAEDANEVTLHVELPGVKQEDIDVELSNDTLTIKGEKKFEHADRKDNFVRVERSYGTFQRTFTVGVPIQSDSIAAGFKDGILTVRLPKSEATKPKKVAIAGG